MKILHVISGGETGGSKNHLLSLFKGERSHEMMLLVFQKGKLYDEALKEGINVELMEQKSRYDLSFLKKFRTYIQSNHFDIVHSHGARANLFVRLIKNRLHAQWAVTVHSDPDLDFMHNKKMSTLFSALNKWSLAKTDKIFAVSDRFKSMLKNYGIPDNKIVSIYNGISFDREKIRGDRTNLSLSEDDFTAAIVARLHPVKGHSVLFKAIASIKDKIDLTVLIVGEGDLKNTLLNEAKSLNIEKNLRFLGFRSDIDELLSLSDVSLLTSKSESFPLVLLESAREETPVITTDVGGVRSLIPDPSYGWVVAIDDHAQLASALMEAYSLKKSGELTEKGKKLRNHAENNFSLRHLQDSLLKEYKKMLNK
ncbi:glycosyltransferase family 4 protein [Jeotgalibacillus sp. ET6]|uniref:glycosyltransferase family 4 protein n=1 Tax=Jeotgalibacillus sp. ET6 TaxID=3037260 RepID=UPI0024184395|nr:glycosyltransferase family 4 protein [Jeotgalibacillus sp. ET6]MDG5471579.1 glycosyltransferase family 4 protein [Jeotgalibacillus sp. ET6]